MWNKPTARMLQKVPDIKSGENTPAKEKKVYLKFFLGGWTWYITEIDHKNWDTMFGLVVSPMMPQGEWGYISLKELAGLKMNFLEVDREVYQVSPHAPKLINTILKEDRVVEQ